MEDFKILIVDDEEDFVKTLSERMELRDIKADVANGGQQALEKFEEDEHTVMVLDLRMPGIDGIEVLQKIKRAYPKTQVIILTGKGSENDAVQARELGAFAYLKKPVEMDTLMETVKAAHKKFKRIKADVDAGFKGAANAAAGELDIARQVMEEEKKRKK